MKKIILSSVLIAIIAAVFGLRWAILTGRAKRKQADAKYHVETNLRTIYHAEREYYVSHEFLGFTCTLSDLGGATRDTGPGTPVEHYLDQPLATGHADGYTFTLSNCKHEENVGFHGILTYHLTATPDPGSDAPPPTYCVDDNVDNIPRGEYVLDRPGIMSDSDCTQIHPVQ